MFGYGLSWTKVENTQQAQRHCKSHDAPKDQGIVAIAG